MGENEVEVIAWIALDAESNERAPAVLKSHFDAAVQRAETNFTMAESWRVVANDNMAAAERHRIAAGVAIERERIAQLEITRLTRELAAAREDGARLDWMDKNAFTAYRDRDLEHHTLNKSVVVVDEDASGSRTGRVHPTIREAIDAALAARTTEGERP